MLRCCKRPSDEDGPLYDAVTAVDSRYPVAPYFERRTVVPSVFHQGNRGLTRDRILQEGDLFLAARVELAQPAASRPNPYRGMQAQQIHRNLREALLPKFPWLSKPATARISAGERSADFLRLFGFLAVVLFVLSIPGLLLLVSLKAFLPGSGLGPLLLLLVVPALATYWIYKWRSARRGEAAPTQSGGLTLSTKNKATSLANPFTFSITAALSLGIVVLAIALVLTFVMSVIDVLGEPLLQAFREGSREGFGPGFSRVFAQLWWPTVGAVFVGLYSAVAFSLPALFVWLRWLERRDSHHDNPPVDPRELRKMTRREDKIPQNHMGSVVVVKPGVLRTALFRAGHLGLGLVLRVVATDGYLGSMRTVHFAHWAFV